MRADVHNYDAALSRDYEDIYQVSPWAQLAGDLGQDLNEPHIACPRLFKTHQRLSAINAGGKYLVTVRDPTKVLISWCVNLKEALQGRPPVH